MNITPELLKRYTAGLCTPAEMQAVEQWLDDPDAPLGAIRGLAETDRQESASRVWKRLHSRSARPLWAKYRHYWSGLAALLVLVSGMIWYAARVRNAENARPATARQSVRTQKGETRRLALPDGSVVMLGYDSELRYPSAFSDSVRRVVLLGEAQFSVKKNPEKPFIVETAAAETRVLGTVFNVKEYPGEGSTALLVTEGKVCFIHKTTAQSAILTAGNAGIIAGKQLRVRPVSGADGQVAWLQHALRFDDVPLAHVTRELERRYNVRITIRDHALKSQRYTGTFKNPSLNAVLGSMGIAVGFRYEVQGESISLYEQ